jgi:hypothetical protein
VLFGPSTATSIDNGTAAIAGGIVFHRFASSLLLASLTLFGPPRTATAQDADAAEVQRYVLTEAALAKYTQATRNLAAVESACEEQDSDAESIDEMVAALNAMPGADQALQAAGIAPREYVVFSLSLLQNGLAAFAASQPGGQLPPGVSRANVDFVTKHNADLEQLAEIQFETCESALDEDDSEGE